MKKLLLLVLFFFLLSFYAFGSNNYPVIMNNGTIFFNTGIGFRSAIARGGSRQIHPLTASLDIALPLFGLPLTVGLISGYFTEEGYVSEADELADNKTEFGYWPIAGRLAYHINVFNNPRFDTYILMTIGGIIRYVDSQKDDAHFWFGLSAGARYFFLPRMGAYLELGLDSIQTITFGLSFKI